MTSRLVTLLIALALLGGGLVIIQMPQSATYYVSPNGNDNNAGTWNSPWKTLQYALGQLSPGDLLYVRGGLYFENEIRTGLHGTAAAPITIQAYPGEHAIVDGGVPFFRDAPNAEWELVDASLQLYRSQRTFSGSFVRAWLLDYDVQMVEYEAQADMESTNYGPVNGLAPFYMGPGVQLRGDGHIYIRLQYNPNDLTDPEGQPLNPVPLDTNPNHNRLAVFTSDNVLTLDGAQYLHFKGLEFSGAKTVLDARNGSQHIQFSDCRINYGTYGLVVRDTTHDWDIANCEFNNGLPDYVYWTDVKNGDVEVAEAYPEFQSSAIDGPLPGFNVHDNVFRNTFDGLNVTEGTHDAVLNHNTFRYTRDDAINLSRGISNVEVAHNMLWHVASGISNLGSTAAPGPVYIHHNVIDNSAYQRGGRPGNYRAADWPVWTVLDPFGHHGNANTASWWKLYNNTIVTRRGGYEWSAAGPDDVSGNPEKYVYNNIFYALDDRVIFRDDQAATGSHYDGDLIYRYISGDHHLFVNFGNGDDYESLASFRAASGTDWEARGLETDPGFDLAAINDPVFDPGTIWNRYRPTTCPAAAPGVSYNGLNWPETSNVLYRGAMPVSSSQLCPFINFLPNVIR